LKRLFAAIRELTGASVEPVYAEPRAGDVRDSQADITKAETLLGYRPTVPFEEGLRRTLEWYHATRATSAV
jgi:nucleoside-diphosphate-sugar epimerase